MKEAAEEMYNSLLNTVNTIMQGNDPLLLQTEKAIIQINESLQEVKLKIKERSFKSDQDKIYFYKYISPKFLSLYILRASIYNIESAKTLGDKKALKKYYSKHIKAIESYHELHQPLFTYWKSGKTDFDHFLFTKNTDNNWSAFEIYAPIIDIEFCTIYGLRIATMIANEQLQAYINKAIDQLKNPSTTSTQIAGVTTLQWTESKTALIEIIYAFFAAGAFNNGKVQLKEIFKNFEIFFHIDIGTNAPRTFQEILARQSGYTNYLNKLITKLLQYIDAIEQRHIK